MSSDGFDNANNGKHGTQDHPLNDTNADDITTITTTATAAPNNLLDSFTEENGTWDPVEAHQKESNVTSSDGADDTSMLLELNFVAPAEEAPPSSGDTNGMLVADLASNCDGSENNGSSSDLVDVRSNDINNRPPSSGGAGDDDYYLLGAFPSSDEDNNPINADPSAAAMSVSTDATTNGPAVLAEIKMEQSNEVTVVEHDLVAATTVTASDDNNAVPDANDGSEESVDNDSCNNVIVDAPIDPPMDGGDVVKEEGSPPIVQHLLTPMKANDETEACCDTIVVADIDAPDVDVAGGACAADEVERTSFEEGSPPNSAVSVVVVEVKDEARVTENGNDSDDIQNASNVNNGEGNGLSDIDGKIEDNKAAGNGKQMPGADAVVLAPEKEDFVGADGDGAGASTCPPVETRNSLLKVDVNQGALNQDDNSLMIDTDVEANVLSDGLSDLEETDTVVNEDSKDAANDQLETRETSDGSDEVNGQEKLEVAAIEGSEAVANGGEDTNEEQKLEETSKGHDEGDREKITEETETTPIDVERKLDASSKLGCDTENETDLCELKEKEQVMEEDSKNDEALLALSEENEILSAQLESTRSMIIQFEEKQKAEEKLIVELQEKMTVQMTARAEAEDRLKQFMRNFDETSTELQSKLMEQIETTTVVEEQLNETKFSLTETSSELELVKNQLESAESFHAKEKNKLGDENRRMNTELTKARKKIEEFEMDVTSLTARLNEAKKVEASKTREAARSTEKCTAFEEEVKILQDEKTRGETLQTGTVTKMKTIEGALEKERQLNATRKAKMKQYVEVQSSEIKSLKATNARLMNEMEDWKTEKANILKRSEYLEREYAQSEVALKDLQKENENLRTDSEKLSKIGGHLEKETEDLKKKRLTAKHETMTLLRSLEVERSISSKLQHELKFTLLPKALSQQELLSESLKVLEGDLELLTRTKFANQVSQHYSNGGRGGSYDETDGKFEHSEDIENSGGDDTKQNKTSTTVPKQQAEYLRLLNNLEDESKKVSMGILALTSNVDRLHDLTVNDMNSASTGDRNCVSAFSDFLMGVSNNNATPAAASGAPVLYTNIHQNTQ